MTLHRDFEWTGPSGDPHDEQFGDVVDHTTLANAAQFDAVLVGEPYDGAVIGREGASEGPRAIRDALAATKTHHFDAGPVQHVGDLGTIAIPASESVSGVQAAIRETTAVIHDLETLPVFLGGDNSLTYANVAPLIQRCKNETEQIGVVNLDAHLDFRRVEDEPTSGTPYRQLVAEGLDAVAVVGARHFETSTAYAREFREAGGEIVTAEEVADDPVTATDHALDAMQAVDHVYLSVDVDVLDTVAAPGVSAPTPGGITSRELFRTIRLLASTNRLAGLEIVETAPSLCLDGRTPRTAARTIAHALAVAGEA